jgi:predicted nuclease with TOPRIM domain
MKANELQAENEALKAQIAGISFNLKNADAKIKQLEMQLDQLHKQNLNLVGEVKHLNMKMSTNNNNQNDSRYY